MNRLTAPALELPGVVHGFFGRPGGVSGGLYESLNCGTGSRDAPEAVAENRRRVAAALGRDMTLVSLRQVHSALVHVLPLWDGGAEGDAMVTATPGLALGILTADCAPVLLADPKAGVIGAAHAGWKGALGGVLEATVAAMEKLGAARGRIAAAIGPCISQANYEVGAEMRARILEKGPAHRRFFVPADRPGHFRFDLEAYGAERLERAGIGPVTRLGVCTYPDANGFFSYRRATHRDESDYGREISAIALTG